MRSSITLSTATSRQKMTDARWQAVTWLLVILGWIVVHYLTVVRERQKEVGDLKTQVVESILQVERDAIAFHQSAGHDSERARMLVTDLSRIGQAIANPPICMLCVHSRPVREFRKSVTLRNFDPTNFRSQHPSSRLVSEITRCADDLIAAIKNSYSSRYLEKWWQCFRV